jgi:hypothetical protein
MLHPKCSFCTPGKGIHTPQIRFYLVWKACFCFKPVDTNPLATARRLFGRCVAVGNRGDKSREPCKPPGEFRLLGFSAVVEVIHAVLLPAVF